MVAYLTKPYYSTRFTVCNYSVWVDLSIPSPNQHGDPALVITGTYTRPRSWDRLGEQIACVWHEHQWEFHLLVYSVHNLASRAALLCKLMNTFEYSLLNLIYWSLTLWKYYGVNAYWNNHRGYSAATRSAVRPPCLL